MTNKRNWKILVVLASIAFFAIVGLSTGLFGALKINTDGGSLVAPIVAQQPAQSGVQLAWDCPGCPN
jgi:hypothetical protein